MNPKDHAFPVAFKDDQWVHDGMSVRTYAAIHIMPAVIRQCAAGISIMGGAEEPAAYFARKTIECVDALMKELSK